MCKQSFLNRLKTAKIVRKLAEAFVLLKNESIENEDGQKNTCIFRVNQPSGLIQLTCSSPLWDFSVWSSGFLFHRFRSVSFNAVLCIALFKRTCCCFSPVSPVISCKVWALPKKTWHAIRRDCDGSANNCIMTILEK